MGGKFGQKSIEKVKILKSGRHIPHSEIFKHSLCIKWKDEFVNHKIPFQSENMKENFFLILFAVLFFRVFICPSYSE